MKIYLLRIICVLLLLTSVSSCKNNERQKAPVRAFYFWKTTFKLAETERKILSENNINKLYIRLFDVDWNAQINKPIPLGTIRFAEAEDSLLRKIEIVPVVYITTKTLQHISLTETRSLADSIYQKVNRICKNINISWKELQLDCDWTETTREKYFSLLTYMENHLQRNQFLSATIRLHQIKYRKKTGVPPVKRGMLMFYNMGKIGLEENSVYDYENAAKYTGYVKNYPLPLDVVLPAFSWTIQKRNGKVLNLLNEMNSRDFTDKKHFSEQAYMRFKTEKSFYYKGHYFMEKDVLQVEEIAPELCKKAAKQISAELKPQSRTIAIFDLDSAQLQQYEKEDFTSIFGAFE